MLTFIKFCNRMFFLLRHQLTAYWQYMTTGAKMYKKWYKLYFSISNILFSPVVACHSPVLRGSCLCVILFYLYTVSQTTVQNCFCQNFLKFPPTLIIYGTQIAQRINLCDMHSFSTSPNLCERPTVLNSLIIDLDASHYLHIVIHLIEMCGCDWFKSRHVV